MKGFRGLRGKGGAPTISGWLMARTGLAVAALVLGTLISVSVPAGAHATGAVGRGHSKSPVGAYDEFSSNGGSGVLVVDAGNTFETSFGDSGYWLSVSSSIGLMVTKSSEEDVGCVYLGKVGSHGINSDHKQGPTNCGGTKDTWYATHRSRAEAPSLSRAPGSGVGPSTDGAVKPYPAYNGFQGPQEWTLFINPDGSAEIKFTEPPYDFGFWVNQGSALAFTAVPPGLEFGPPCLYMGTLSKKGISSPSKSGQAVCAGMLKSWYATKQ
jgi:hypothetical protein